jgi:hypothetical protein
MTTLVPAGAIACRMVDNGVPSFGHATLSPDQKISSNCARSEAFQDSDTGSFLRPEYSLDIDIEHCPNCAGALKIIAAIEDPPGIARILTHLGLPTRAPPRAPAQRFDLFQTT